MCAVGNGQDLTLFLLFLPTPFLCTVLTETTHFPYPAKAGAQYCGGSTRGRNWGTGLRR